MAENCIYNFGEFNELEGLPDELFTGYLDCSTEINSVDCQKLFLYASPHVSSQWELDYNLLFNYAEDSLYSLYQGIVSKLRIGKDITGDLNESDQVYRLINYLLLFKEELKKDPTINNYISLFTKYEIPCVNKYFRDVLGKSDIVKDMLTLLNVKDLISLSEIIYQLDTNLDLDPIYYIADL